MFGDYDWASPLTQPEWTDYVSISNLESLYSDSIKKNTGPGIDRISHRVFRKRLHEELAIVERMCLDGSYRFTPFRELLVPKRADQPPRQISIPTIRDRVALKAIQRFLDAHLRRNAGPRPPSAVKCVQRLVKGLQQPDFSTEWCVRDDIEDFFPSVRHERLLAQLTLLKVPEPCLSLVKKALLTPTVRPGGPRTPSQRGIPQGLSISSLLAHIYLSSLDVAMREQRIHFHRYADDLVLFGADAAHLRQALEDALSGMGLSRNSRKGSVRRVSEGFEFIGYEFSDTTISVGQKAVQHFYDGIASKVAKYRHMNSSRKKSRDVIDLINEKIGGAISQKKRYGWLFHFLEMNDLPLLFQMQEVVSSIVGRVGLASELKRLPRAYHEARHDPRRSGYIRDYDRYDTLEKQAQFLSDRGRDVSDWADEKIKVEYERFRERRLTGLQQDAFYLS